MSISLVQNTSNNVPGSPMTLAFTSDVTTGNLLIVGVGNSSGGLAMSYTVTDTLGNTYVSLGQVEDISGGPTTDLLWCIANGSGANTVTVSYTSGSGIALHVAEFSGVSAVDQNAASSDNTGTSADSGPVTTNFANELLIGALSSSGAPTAGTGWTLLSSQGATLRSALEYQIVSSTGTYDATFTIGSGKSGTPNWGLRIATFFSGLNVPLSGVSSTTQIGSVTVSGTANVILTGVSSAAALGTAIPAVTVRAIGISSAAFLGTATATGDANATGSITPVTTLVGTLTITGTAALVLTGVSSTGIVGTPVIEVRVFPTGVSSTSHIGAASIALAKTPTGIQSTSHVGSLTIVSTDVIHLVGIQVTCSVGFPLVECNSAFPVIVFLGM